MQIQDCLHGSLSLALYQHSSGCRLSLTTMGSSMINEIGIPLYVYRTATHVHMHQRSGIVYSNTARLAASELPMVLTGDWRVQRLVIYDCDDFAGEFGHHGTLTDTWLFTCLDYA